MENFSKYNKTMNLTAEIHSSRLCLGKNLKVIVQNIEMGEQKCTWRGRVTEKFGFSPFTFCWVDEDLVAMVTKNLWVKLARNNSYCSERYGSHRSGKNEVIPSITYLLSGSIFQKYSQNGSSTLKQQTFSWWFTPELHWTHA